MEVVIKSLNPEASGSSSRIKLYMYESCSSSSPEAVSDKFSRKSSSFVKTIECKSVMAACITILLLLFVVDSIKLM